MHEIKIWKYENKQKYANYRATNLILYILKNTGNLTIKQLTNKRLNI